MSQFCIYVPLDNYLAQWFINEHGGNVPVKLIRGSVESKLLEVYIDYRPRYMAPDCGGPGTVPVFVPTFRNRPPEVFNYLPPHAMTALQNIIRNRFDVQLWTDLHHFGKIGKRQDELIYAWMEKHGIDSHETNWNAIAKRYQRQRHLYQMREWNKTHYTPKKSS